VLLFLFGSKDDLLRALLARARADELTLLEGNGRPAPGGDLAEVVRTTWEWLAASEHRPLLTLWAQAYARSLGEPEGPGPVSHARPSKTGSACSKSTKGRLDGALVRPLLSAAWHSQCCEAPSSTFWPPATRLARALRWSSTFPRSRPIRLERRPSYFGPPISSESLDHSVPRRPCPYYREFGKFKPDVRSVGPGFSSSCWPSLMWEECLRGLNLRGTARSTKDGPCFFERQGVVVRD